MGDCFTVGWLCEHGVPKNHLWRPSRDIYSFSPIITSHMACGSRRIPWIFAPQINRDVPGTNFLPGTEYRVLRRFFTGSGYRIFNKLEKVDEKWSTLVLHHTCRRQQSRQVQQLNKFLFAIVPNID